MPSACLVSHSGTAWAHMPVWHHHQWLQHAAARLPPHARTTAGRLWCAPGRACTCLQEFRKVNSTLGAARDRLKLLAGSSLESPLLSVQVGVLAALRCLHLHRFCLHRCLRAGSPSTYDGSQAWCIMVPTIPTNTTSSHVSMCAAPSMLANAWPGAKRSVRVAACAPPCRCRARQERCCVSVAPSRHPQTW